MAGVRIQKSSCAADIPFFLMNTWACVLVIYGLVGLRYQGWAIMQFMGIISLHALVTNQFVTMCIWLTSSQVSFLGIQIQNQFQVLRGSLKRCLSREDLCKSHNCLHASPCLFW